MALKNVFFKIDFGNNQTGKLVFQLFDKETPKTAANFRALCAHEKGFGYQAAHFHGVITNFIAQGGDFTNHNGTGGKSIYGRTFPDENFLLKHDVPGLLSMANAGPNTNGSQFFITFVPCPWLNGKHTVFGKVVDGKDVLTMLHAIGSDSGKPKSKATILECG